MLTIIITGILLTILTIMIIYGAMKIEKELLLLINMVTNPYRFFHILAFFGILFAMVFIVIKYFQLLVEISKLLDV